jgi:hypothetical protein
LGKVSGAGLGCLDSIGPFGYNGRDETAYRSNF